MHPSPGADAPQHRWLKWLGLAEPPPDPDAWVPVCQDGRVTDEETGASSRASEVAQLLADAGIEAHQRHLVLPDTAVRLFPLGTEVPADDRIRVAVLVHQRDLAQARRRLAAYDGTVDGGPGPDPISDAELARQALEAGPAPDES